MFAYSNIVTVSVDHNTQTPCYYHLRVHYYFIEELRATTCAVATLPVLAEEEKQIITPSAQNYYITCTMRVLEYSAKRVLRLTRDKGYVEKGGGKDGDYRFSKVELVIPDGEHPYLSVKYGLKPTVIASVNNIKAVFHKTCEKTVLLTLKNHAGWTKGMVRVHLITFKDETDASDFFTEYNKLVDIVKSELYTTFEEEVVADEEEIEENHHVKISGSTTYGNKLADIVKSELYTFEEEVLADEEEIEEDQHVKNSGSTTYDNKLVDIVKSELYTFEEEVVTVDEEEIEEGKNIKNSGSTTYDDDDSSRSSSDSANDHEWGILSEIDGNTVKSDGKKLANVISSEDVEDLFVDEVCTQDWPF